MSPEDTMPYRYHSNTFTTEIGRMTAGSLVDISDAIIPSDPQMVRAAMIHEALNAAFGDLIVPETER